MTDTTCVVCQRRDHADGWTVCRGCLDRIDGDLERIVELVSWASNWLQPRAGRSNGGRSVPGSKPPLDIASLDAAMANDVLPLLESWERLCREHFQLSPYGPASLSRNAALAKGGPITAPVTVAGCVAFLRANLARIAETPDFPVQEMSEELLDARHHLERLDPLREPGEGGKRLLCPAPHPDADGRMCHNHIYLIPGQPKDDIYCRRCGTTWTTNRLKLLCLHDETQSIMRTPEEIVQIVNVSKRTLQRWAAKGEVKHERQGNRYDLGQVWRLRMLRQSG